MLWVCREVCRDGSEDVTAEREGGREGGGGREYRRWSSATFHCAGRAWLAARARLRAGAEARAGGALRVRAAALGARARAGRGSDHAVDEGSGLRQNRREVAREEGRHIRVCRRKPRRTIRPDPARARAAPP